MDANWGVSELTEQNTMGRRVGLPHKSRLFEIVTKRENLKETEM